MSLHGEYNTDAIIKSFFPEVNYRGVLIEVGAGAPVFLSLQCYIKELGWTTIGVEANPEFARAHRLAGNRIVECAISDYVAEEADFTIFVANSWQGWYSHVGGKVTMESRSALEPLSRDEDKRATNHWEEEIYKGHKVIKVKVRTLDHLFENDLSDVKPPIDVITLDVEGGELKALKGLSSDSPFLPTLFVIESTLAERALQVKEHMLKLGYRLVKSVAYNFFFLKN